MIDGLGRPRCRPIKTRVIVKVRSMGTLCVDSMLGVNVACLGLARRVGYSKGILGILVITRAVPLLIMMTCGIVAATRRPGWVVILDRARGTIAQNAIGMRYRLINIPGVGRG